MHDHAHSSERRYRPTSSMAAAAGGLCGLVYLARTRHLSALHRTTRYLSTLHRATRYLSALHCATLHPRRLPLPAPLPGRLHVLPKILSLSS